MLAERTREHDYLYHDGGGAALFSDGVELVEKAQWLLADDAARSVMAAEGHQRCLEIGLSWEEHIQHEWRIIERVLLQNDILRPEDDAPFWGGFRQGKGF